MAIAVGTTLGALTASVAFANWLATGAGAGSAAATRAIALRTEATTASPTLYPGGTGDLVVAIANDNPYPVTVTDITSNGAVTSSSAECDARGPGVSVVPQSGYWTVAGGSTREVTLSGAVAMAESSHEACEGATFTVPVLLAGRSGAFGPRPASIAISPPSYDFGLVAPGSSATNVFTVRNAGEAAATLSSVSTNGPAFAVSSTDCGSSLPGGATCTVSVRFAPPGTGTFNGMLAVTRDGSVTTNAYLGGRGATPAQLAITPSNYNFGSTPVGQQGGIGQFTVRNTGESPSETLSSQLTGMAASDYVILSTTCGSPLSANATCTVSVQFRPTATGTRTATLVVSSSQSGGTVTAGLSGNGA